MRERTARIRFLSALTRAADALPPRAKVALSGRRPIVIDGLTLDPGVQLMLAARERMGEPDWAAMSVAEARAFTREEAAIARGVPEPVGAVRELQVPGGAGPLRARHYAPADPGGPHPLLVFFHGGGFVAGDLDTHDAPCRTLCRRAAVHVLSVEYRLAPDHAFPAWVEDGVAAFGWAAEHAVDLGADPARVAVGGDSAGGNISAVVAQAALRGEVPAPAVQLLVYPGVDMSRDRRSHELFGDGFFLTSALMDWYRSHFLPDGDPEDVRRSPLLAEDLSGLAPAIVVTAGFDPLRDEGEAYAEAMRAAGVPVVLRRYEGLVHSFFNSGAINRTSREAVAEIAGMLRALLATGDAHAALRADLSGSRGGRSSA